MAGATSALPCGMLHHRRVGKLAPAARERAPPRVAQPAGDRRRRVDVDDEQRLLERGPARHDLAVLVEHEAVAVEDELVLGADRVHERDPARVVARARGQHLLALERPCRVERRRGDVRDDVRARQREIGRGRPRLPDVLADSRPDERVPAAEEHEAATGLEVTVLVEDAVVGQEVLRVHRLRTSPSTHTAHPLKRSRSRWGVPTSAEIPCVSAAISSSVRAAARRNPGRRRRSSGG